MVRLLSILIFTVSGLLTYGQHTFSIVAVDPDTGEIGSAGATCLTSADCNGCGGAVIITEVIPGVGAVNAQATVCLPNVNAAYVANALSNGASAQEALADVLSNDQCQFGNTSTRQYGIVSIIDGVVDAVGYTGESALSHAGHRIGDYYSIQGNILLGPEILDSMEARYLRAEAANLSIKERLMEAMQGANVVGADTRCALDGLSSKSAFLITTGDSETDTQTAIVEDTEPGVDPIDSLQTLVDALDNVTSSTEEVVNVNQVSIHPNPAQDYIQVLSNDTFERYTIYSLDGKLIQSGAMVDNRMTFSVKEDGLHFLSLYADDHKVTKKIMIQRR